MKFPPKQKIKTFKQIISQTELGIDEAANNQGFSNTPKENFDDTTHNQSISFRKQSGFPNNIPYINAQRISYNKLISIRSKNKVQNKGNKENMTARSKN